MSTTLWLRTGNAWPIHGQHWIWLLEYNLGIGRFHREPLVRGLPDIDEGRSTSTQCSCKDGIPWTLSHRSQRATEAGGWKGWSTHESSRVMSESCCIFLMLVTRWTYQEKQYCSGELHLLSIACRSSISLVNMSVLYRKKFGRRLEACANTWKAFQKGKFPRGVDLPWFLVS